jgi:hypothetical protein
MGRDINRDLRIQWLSERPTEESAIDLQERSRAAAVAGDHLCKSRIQHCRCGGHSNSSAEWSMGLAMPGVKSPNLTGECMRFSDLNAASQAFVTKSPELDSVHHCKLESLGFSTQYDSR